VVAIIVEFEVKRDSREEFEARLRQDAAETLCDDGCMRMEILVPRGAADRVLLSELWRDDAAIAEHRSKPGHTHAWQEPLICSKRVIVCEVAA
jgi:quinol monooxygenase YgiN